MKRYVVITMRFIGNKENLLDKIDDIFNSYNIKGQSFFDFFSGTTNVARYYKKKNYEIYSSDLLYLSYCLQKAYIENNAPPEFEQILSRLDFPQATLLSSPLDLIVDYLNQLPGREGFIYQNYTPAGTATLPQPRMYFSDENGKRIDAIRQTIENWRTGALITELEYFILLACLIETVPFYANISGVYAAFQKKWDPRAVKRLTLRPIDIITNSHQNHAYNTDSTLLCNSVSTDILYLDPPYNERQYAPNYHLLETIARYDQPIIKGVTGMRNYEGQKSSFCNAQSAINTLDYIARHAQYRYLALSYNSEGIMPEKEIIAVLSQFGKVSLEQFQYSRFKSNSRGSQSDFVQEQLYILIRS